MIEYYCNSFYNENENENDYSYSYSLFDLENVFYRWLYQENLSKNDKNLYNDELNEDI